MPTLHIRLFGKLCIQSSDDQSREGLDGGKVQELLCYLLLYRDRPHARETLAGLLWGDTSSVQAKKYLRQALWQLQAAVDSPQTPVEQRVLLVESDWVRLNTDADLWLDVAELEQAITRGHEISGPHLDPACAAALQCAVQLYQGDLLTGWYQDWCLFERERLQNLYLGALDKLMGYCEARRAYETGLRYGADILRYDRARERTHRRMMRLYYLAGDRTGALRQFQRCAAALEEELGVPPARRTVALYERIRGDRLPNPARAAPAVVPPTPPERPTVLNHLKQLQQTLTGIQQHIEQEIHGLEHGPVVKREP